MNSLARPLRSFTGSQLAIRPPTHPLDDPTHHGAGNARVPLLTDGTHEVFSAAPHSALFPEKICVSGLTDGLVLSYDACAAGFPVVFSFHPDFRGLAVMKPGGLFFVVGFASLVAGATSTCPV